MVRRHVLSKIVNKCHCPLSTTVLFRPRSTKFWLVGFFPVLYDKNRFGWFRYLTFSTQYSVEIHG